MLTCDMCGSEVKDLSGLNAHYRSAHREEYDKSGWPKIKLRIIGDKQFKKEAAPSEQEGVMSYDEAVESGGKVPEVAEAVVEETPKAMQMPSAPFQIRIDPRVLTAYGTLRSRGKIPSNWSLSNFINEYTLGHVSLKDGIKLAAIQEISGAEGNPGVRVIGMEEGKFREDKKNPEEAIKELQSQEILDLQIEKARQRLEGKDRKEVDVKDEFFDQLQKLSDKIFAQRMAMKWGDKMFGEDSNDGKSDKVKELEDKLKQLEEDKKISELKAEMGKISEMLKSRQSSGDLTPKDIITMMTTFMGQNTKQYQDFKDQLQHKDMELIRQEHDTQAKMLADKLERLENRPRFVDTLKEVTETQKALQQHGFIKKEGERSNVEIIGDLVKHVGDSLTGSPGFQNFLSNMGKQEPQYTPQQVAQLQALQRQQQMASIQPAATSLVPANPEQTGRSPTSDELQRINENLINISDQGDRRRREE